MNIAIVDDEQTELNHLAGLIRRQLSSWGVSTGLDLFSGGSPFLDAWACGSYDLVLLDIYMDGPNGIDVARRIRESDPNVRLVFCTSSNEFASESYEVRAHDYLRKPVTEEGIADMFRRLNMEDYERNRLLLLPDGKQVILHNIIYTEYFNHVVTIHNQRGPAIQTRIAHSELERLLCRYPYFCCCSRGVLVNFHAVARHSIDTFLMNDGTTVPISRRKSKEVQDAYTRFLFEKTRAEVKNHATIIPNR